MIAARTVPRPEARELRACALAALAEACVIVLPLHLVLTESRGLDISPPGLAIPFLTAFVGGAVLACRFRASRNVTTSAVIAAVLAGVAVGGADVNTTAFAAVAALLVALRVVTLGLRDWRSPIHAEIGWGALAIGVEAMIASGAEPDWRPLLVAFVPTFFVAALASRATTVWTSGGVQDLDERVRASWIRRAVFATGALVAAMALAVGLSVRGGLFDRIGRLLTPVAEALVAGLAWLMAQAARPVFWLVDRFGIDPEGVRDFFDRLRTGGLGDRDDLAPGETALWQRLLGLLAFAAVAYGLYRVLRRSRAHVTLEEPRAPRVSVSTSPVEEESLPRRLAFRRELPADAVRRLYAEALLALRRADLRKEPALTPAEFVPEVAEAFPACEAGFVELTRAYEDVRYGSLRLDPERVRALEREHRRIVSAVREAGPDR